MAENKTVFLGGVRGAWGQSKTRNVMKIMIGLAIVSLISVYFFYVKSADPKRRVAESASVDPLPAVKTDVTAAVTPTYRKMVDEDDQRRAIEAQRSPLETSLPTVTGLSTIRPETVVVAQPVRSTAPGSYVAQPVQQQGQNQTPPPPTQEQLDAAARATPAYLFMQKSVDKVVREMAGSNQQNGIVVVRAATDKVAGQGASAGATAGQGNQGPTTPNGVAQAPMTPAKVLIRGGQAFYGVMDIATNSDYSGDVVATVLQGKYKDSKVVGRKVLERDAVVVKFTTLNPADGSPALPISAYAINLGDVSTYGTTGLAGDVDYHTFERYFLPAIMSFAQAYGLASSVSSQTIASTATTTSISQDRLSSKDRALVALGGAATPIVTDLMRNSQRPITVKTNANMEIGILFTQEVTDKTAEAAMRQAATGMPYPQPQQMQQAQVNGMTPNSQQQMQYQQQQQYQPQYLNQSQYPNQMPMGGQMNGSIYQQPGFAARSGYAGGGYNPGAGQNIYQQQQRGF